MEQKLLNMNERLNRLTEEALDLAIKLRRITDLAIDLFETGADLQMITGDVLREIVINESDKINAAIKDNEK